MVNKKFILILIGMLTWGISVFAAPKYTTFQIKISNPDSTPLTAASVTFKFSTLPPTGNCVLYSEQFNAVNMSASAGFVNFNLGTGAMIHSGYGTGYADVYNNSVAAITCAGGGSYNPLANDRRRISVQFNDGTAAGWQTLNPIDINSVPYSTYSGDSEKLAGHPLTDFILASILPGSACSGGQVLTYSGGNLSCVSSGTGTVTNVTSANSYLTVTNGTSTPTLTVNVGTVANTLAAGDDSRITGAAQKANNLSDLASATTARTNLGLGSAAVLNAGTSANNLVQLDGTAKIPSALLPTGTVTTATALVGDVTGTIGATVVSTVGSKTAAQVSQSVTDTLAATDANTVSTIVKRDASGNFTAGTVTATNLSSTNVSTKNVYLYDNTNTNRILLKAPTSGITNHTLILPATQGAASSVLTNDGSGNLSWAAPAATGVTSVTSANTDISVANSTTTPVLALNSGTSANQILKLDGTAKIPAVDGSQVTNLDPTKLSAAVAINKGGTGATTAAAAINNLLPTQTSNSGKVLQTDGTNVSWASASGGTVTSVTGTAPISIATGTSTPVVSIANGTAAGQTLRWDGTSAWAKTKLQYTDLVNNVSASPWPVSSCTAGQAITWSSASDTFSCTTIALSASNFSSQTANTILAAPNGSAGTPTFRTLVSADLPAGIATQWATTGSDIYYNTGKVGIGLASPAYKLDVVGDVNITGNFKVNGVNISTGGGSVTSVTSANSDIAIANTSTTPTLTLNTGTSANQILKLDGTAKIPAVDGSQITNLDPTNLSAAVAATKGGTGQSSYTVGDILYASTTTALSRLPASTSGYVLTSNGAGAAPSWQATSGNASTANPLSQFAATTSAQLAGVLSDETGTGLAVFGTSPTFTTNITSPMIIGGTGTTSTLTYKTTTGVGTTGADHIFQVGNNGATEAMRILNSGNVGIGNASPAYKLDVTGDINVTGNFKVNGTNIATGGGTVTSITAGTGLTGGAITSTGTIGLDAELAAVNGISTTGFVKRTAAATYSTASGISLTADVSGTLPIANGGTGATTATAAINNLLPTQTSNTGKVLQTDGTNVSWAAASGGTVTSVTGTAPISVATGTSTPVISIANGTATGQVLRWDGTSAWAKTKLTYADLINNVAASPWPASSCTAGQGITWSSASDTFSCTTLSIATSQLTGTVAAANGGTGQSSYTVGDILYASTTTALSRLPASTSGYVLTSNGAGAAPSWQAASAAIPANTISSYVVRVATNANITLSGAQTIDGVSVVAGDRVLVKNQSVWADNGVYVVASGAWSRATDMSSWAQVLGYTCYVSEGTSFGGARFTIAVASFSGTLGSTGIYPVMNGSGQNSNAGFGRGALSANTTGSQNVAVGQSLFSNTTGTNNSAAGYTSMYINSTGSGNASFGASSMYLNTIGNYNVAFGFQSLYSNKAKSESTSVGYSSMKYADDSTSAATSYNTAIGAYSLQGSITASSNTGIKNTALGHSSLLSIQSGSNNIGIGYNSGSAITTGSNNVVIGSNTGSTIATTSNYILISDGAGNERIRVDNSGNVGIGNASPGQKLDVTGNIKASGQMAAGSQTISGGTNAIDWNNGNVISTDYNCASSIAFANMIDGGTYTLVVTSTATTQCSFSATTTGTGAGTVSYRYLPANAARTASSHTVYTLLRVGSVVYVSWATGF